VPEKKTQKRKTKETCAEVEKKGHAEKRRMAEAVGMVNKNPEIGPIKKGGGRAE